MTNNECTKCIHKEVCKTAESCDGFVSGCKHFVVISNLETTTREKLIALLDIWMEFETAEQHADYLIANGVTVQEEAKLYWKPVKPGEWNLTCSACDSHLGCREDANFCPECGAKFVYPKAVAPQPPKGE